LNLKLLELRVRSCSNCHFHRKILDRVYCKPMPKLKTRKAAAKRFRITGTGKIMRRKPFRNHLLEHKTSAKKCKLAQYAVIHDTDVERVQLMLPYL